MSTAALLEGDLVAAGLTAVAWAGAGILVLSGRRRWAALAALAGMVLFGGWVAWVAVLAGRGWWFVQDKVVVTLPLTAAAIGYAAWRATAVLSATETDTARDSAGGAALLTTGYAAATGLVLPLLVGYPASWSVALLSAGVVAVAAWLTHRVVGPDTPRAPRPAGGVQPVIAGVFAVGLLFVAGVALAFRPATTEDLGGGAAPRYAAGTGTPVSELVGPAPSALPAGVTVDRYTLTAQTGTITLSSGRRVSAWTFDGESPGPQITAVQGDLIEATLRDVDVKAGVTIHWHGYDVPAAEDGAPGVTQDPVLPGQQFVYRFMANQAGTYWYHTHEVSDQGVTMGLYGMLVVRPRGAPVTGLDTTAPIHTYDGRLVVGDHDTPEVHTVAPGTPVRLRIVNTDSVTHRLTLAGAPFRLAAVDGTDVSGPGTLTRTALRLAAGGRYDLTFSMAGAQVALLVDDATGGGVRVVPGVGATSAPPDTSAWPTLDLGSYGTPTTEPVTLHSQFDRRFSLVLDQGVALAGGRPGYDYTIDGRAYPSTPTLVVSGGDLVLMTVVNRGLTTHPWHLHGHRVLVLSVDGRPTTGSPLWMDTFEVRPGEVYQVAFRADNPGMWMNHCHNLAHADQGMMMLLRYDGIVEDLHGAHGG